MSCGVMAVSDRKVNPLLLAILVVAIGVGVQASMSPAGCDVGIAFPFISAPIPDSGFRVLIVEEAQERVKLPSSQLSIFTSKELTDYCDSKCVKVNDTPEFRVYDKDVVFTAESEIWRKAMQIERKSLPWLIVSNGRSGYSGPLPMTLDETMKILKRYGG